MRAHHHAPLDRIAGLLYELQKGVKAIRAFPQPFLVEGLALLPRLRPVVEKAALAIELRVGDYGQVIFQTRPLREAPLFPARGSLVLCLGKQALGIGGHYEIVTMPQ